MGALSRSEKAVAATTGVLTQNDSEPHITTDKLMMEGEAGIESPGHGNAVHVTPEMEKRLLRKLDRRIVPLIMVLCMLPVFTCAEAS